MEAGRDSQLRPIREMLDRRVSEGATWQVLQDELRSFTSLSEDEWGELALYAWAVCHRRENPLPFVRFPEDVPFPG